MYIDAHAYLDQYGSELAEAITQIEQQEILTLSVSMDPAAYEKNKAIVRRNFVRLVQADAWARGRITTET